MSRRTVPPFLPPGSRFLLIVLSSWLLLQTLLIFAGSILRNTENAFRPGFWLLIFTLGITAAVFSHRPLARESGSSQQNDEKVLLALAIVLPLFFSPVSTVAFLTPKFFLLGFFTLYFIHKGHLPGYPLQPADRPWLLLFIILIAGCLRGPDLPAHIAMGLPVLGVWGAYAIIARTMRNLSGQDVVLRVTDLLLACSVIPALYAILQNFDLDYTGVFQIPGGRAQVFATMGNVNWLGIYLAMLLPLAVIRFRLARTSGALLSSWCIGHLIAIALLFTRSRSSWLAAVTALIWLTVCRFRLGKTGLPQPLPSATRLIKFEPLIILGLLIVFSTPMLTGVSLPDRIARTFKADYNVAQRFHVWRIALDLFSARPLLGNGTGSFARDFLDAQARRLSSETAEDRLQLGGNAREAHNEYIQFLAENGILGFLAICFLLLTLLTRIRQIFERGDSSTAWLAAGWSALTVAILSDASFSFPFQVPVPGLLFAMACGVFYLLRPTNREDSASAKVRESGSLPTILSLILMVLLILTVIADGLTAIGGNRMKYNRMAEGKPLLETALKLQPWRGDTLFLLGTANQSLNQVETAEALLIQAQRFTNDQGIATNLAFLLNQRGEKTAATSLFRKAWLYEPRSCESACNLALNHLQCGETAEAELFLNRAVTANPSYPPAWNELGFLQLRKKQSNSARHSFEKIVTRSPAELAETNFRFKVYLYTNPTALHAEYAKAWYGLARVALLEKDTQKAEDCYQQSLKFQAGNPLVTYQYGLLLVQNGRFTEAEKMLIQISENPGPWGKSARKLLENLQRMVPR